MPPRSALYRPVRTSERSYRHGLAEELLRLAEAMPEVEQRRWRRRAYAVRQCSENVLAVNCAGCGSVQGRESRVLVSCGLRTCPTCARYRADRLRAKFFPLVDRCELGGPLGFSLITFTTRYDPSSEEDLSVAGLRARFKLVADGVARVWKHVLKAENHAMAVGFEVASGGMLHAHALYYGARPEIEVVRDAWLWVNPDSPIVHVVGVGGDGEMTPREAALEVIKYIAKAASPKRVRGDGSLGEYTDPRLAATIEVAFAGRRLVRSYGAWHGVKLDELPDVEEPRDDACAECGSTEREERLVPRDAWNRLVPGWVPRFGKPGKAPPQKAIDDGITRHPGRGHEHGELRRAAEEAGAEGGGGGVAAGGEPQDGARDADARRPTAPSLRSRRAHPDPRGTLVAHVRPRRAAAE